jgi:hypothetical protein
MDEAERELRELAEGLDIEEAVTQQERETDDDDDDDDDDDGWREERAKMSTTDWEELDESVRLVRMLLVKVSASIRAVVQIKELTGFLQLHKISFAIIHSSTILLPLWFATLEKLKLEEKKMP